MAQQGGTGLGSPVGQPLEMGPIPVRMMLAMVLLFILGLAGMALSAGLGVEVEGAKVVGLVGVALLLAALALWFQRQRQKGTLQLHERGLSFSRKGTRQEIPFTEMRELSLKETPALNNGHPVGVERRFYLLASTGKLSFMHMARHGQSDAVGPFLNQLYDRVVEAQAPLLATGHSLSGKGWTLKAEGIQAKDGIVPLAQVGRVGIFDAKISCWRLDEDEPFLSVAVSSPNALLLWRYVSARLSKPGLPSRGLGPVLFSKHTSRWLIGVVVLLMTPLAKLLLMLIWPAEDRATFWLTTGGGLALALALGAILWRYRFECREEGLSVRTLWGHREVRYADIERMQFKATRQYVNGVYGGTHLDLSVFLPNGQKLRLEKSCKGMDQDLDRLREHISSLVATRLQARLEQGQAVAWGSFVQLHRDGLTLRPDQLIGRGQPVTLPYAALAAPVIEGGILRLLDLGTGKKLCSFPCADDNFYPGLMVFMSRWKS